MNNDNNKDISNSLNKYTDYAHKGTNLVLDSVENINKWYEKQLDKITEDENSSSRIETVVDNNIETNITDNNKQSKITTRIEQYNEIQTNNIKQKNNIVKADKINTNVKNENSDEIIKTFDNNKLESNNAKGNISKKISTTIKGAKFINNSTQKIISTGKNISTGLNENGATAFKGTSTKIMTKPVKKVANKISSKVTKETIKYTKKFAKKIENKVAKKITKQVISKTTKAMTKVMQLLIKLLSSAVKTILAMLPQVAPVLIIIVIVVSFCSFFGIGMSEDTRKSYETYMINTQNEYNQTTVEFYNSGKVVDGTIEGKGMINWRAPLAIVQMLNGELIFDDTEKELLNKFKDAELFEKITDSTYTYEKEVEVTNDDGSKTTSKETVTETKKIVSNPSLNDYIKWCNDNFNIINTYKKKKKLNYNSNQTKFTDDEIEQIKLLYNSNSFFELFSAEFKSTYAYLNVNIGDEQLRAIYEEFLKNVGKRYLMDHSNLKYDECMEYYDCSSWVIHCLAHTGIITIPNTGAQGIYNGYCYSVDVNDRKAGDLIFLKDTYDTGEPRKHISYWNIYGNINNRWRNNRMGYRYGRKSIRSTN